MSSTLNCHLRIDIQPRCAFDCRTECAANLHFLSSNAIVFPVGRHLAVQRLDLLSASAGEGGARAGVSGSTGGQHLQQSMGFLVRPLGHPPPHEEGGAGGDAHAAPASPSPSTAPHDESNGTAPPKPTRHHHTDSTAAYAYMIGMHWNTQSVSRLRLHERDWLSRHESNLLSCFSVHSNRKLLLTCEHSTDLRLVTVSIADIHAAGEEDFTQLSLRRFRTNFLLLPCVQALTSDKGRREARERRLRHEGRKKNLRRVARLKAQRARLEEERLQELKDSVALAALDVTPGSRSRSRNPSRPSSPPLSRDTIASIAPRSLAEELRSVKTELEQAERIVADMGARSDGEEDSDLEGYESEELKSDDEEEDGENDEEQSFSRRTVAGSSLASPTAAAASSNLVASSPRVSFAPDTPAASASPAASRPTPHHRISTESWSNHIRDVKSVDTLGDRGMAASWRAQADAIARAALDGMPLPAIPDPGKEELIFARITAADFSPDGGKFVVLVGDGPRFPLMVWEISTTALLGSNRFVNEAVSKVAFKPAATVLTVVTLGLSHLRVWEVKTKQSEHAHSFLSPIALSKEGASAAEQFVDFTFLASPSQQQQLSMVVLTTERVVILQDDRIITSAVLAPSYPGSVPRAVSATTKGYALAFDGFVDLFEFRKSSTIFVPVAELRDEDGRDFQAAKRERMDAKREDQRQREKEERSKSQKVLQTRHAPTSPGAAAGAGVYQSSLFERLHHLGPADSSATAAAKSPSGKAAATSAERRAEAAAAADLQRRKDELEVFHAKSIPLFRPVPGCPPPPPSGVAAAMAAQCNAPDVSASGSPAATASVSVPQGAHLFLVHSMACSPDEHSLVLTSTTREIIHIPIDDVEVCQAGEESLCVRTITSGLHNGAVNDLSICSEAPLIVSCCTADKTVRVQNYLDRQCELVKQFEFPPLCVSFHPLGHEIAVGFHLNLLTLRVHPTELVVRAEFSLPVVSHCKYSHGGSLLAAVSGKTIFVYAASTTAKTVAKFVGHGDAIMSISWNADDTSLFSVGLSGHVYEWALTSSTRIREFVAYGDAFMDIAVSPTGHLVAAGVALNSPHTFSIHHHEPVSPYQFAGGLHHCHYNPPDEVTQQSLAIGVGFENGKRSVGLFSAPKKAGARSTVEPNDPAFAAAYAYAGLGGGPATFTSFVGAKKGAATQPDDFHRVELEARPALPVYSSFSRLAIAADLRESNAAAQSVAARHTRSTSQHSSAAAALAAASALKRSRERENVSPLVESYRSSSFPHTMPSAFHAHCPPHPKVAWIQMGRIWFILLGTHRGSLELYRLPLWRFPDPIVEVPLHTEPIVSLQVCQKLGVVLSASLDGSIFVSSLAMLPFTFLTQQLPSWAIEFPTYSCLVPNFAKYSLFASLSLSDYGELYQDQKNSITNEHGVLEKYRRSVVEKRMAGSTRNVDNEQLTSTGAALLVRKTAWLDHESTISALKKQSHEFASAWAFKMASDKYTAHQTLVRQEAGFQQTLQVHQDEKERLQLLDIERERIKMKGIEHAERTHTQALTNLERLYERKLALEVQKTQKLRLEFEDRNAKLANDLLLSKRSMQASIDQLRSELEVVRGKHAGEKQVLDAKLSLAEQETINMMEEQDFDNDEERQHEHNDYSARVAQLTSTLSTVQQDTTRLKVELQANKQKNQTLAETVGEWKLRQAEALKTVKDVEAKLRTEQANRKTLEAEVQERDANAAVLAANVSRLDAQRLALREQVAALLVKLDLNDVPRAKLEFETVVRELDSEFREKAIQTSIMQKALQDKSARISTLTKENAALVQTAEESQNLLNRLREDLNCFTDLRSLREKYAEFTTAPSGPQTFRRRIEHEFSRQLQFYSHTTARLAGQLALAESQLDHANERRISESVNVMRQLNDLRHLNKDYKNEVLQVASELNAVKLKERLRRGKLNAANEDRSNSPSRTREALHAPRDPNRHTQLHMSRMLARFVDPASRKSALAPREPGSSTADDADSATGEFARPEDESKTDWPEEVDQAAAMHQQVSLMRQMKEESDAMLLNSYRRIQEQEAEIQLLRDENEKSASSSSSSVPPTVARAPHRSPHPPASDPGERVDSVLQQATQRRLLMESGSPVMSPRPPQSARSASSALSSPLSTPRVSGSQTARAAASPSHSASARSDVPKVAVPKRWQQVQPALPPPTSALPYSNVAALTPRANATIAQAKLAGRGSSARSTPASSPSGSAPRFDTASLFRAAEDAAAQYEGSFRAQEIKSGILGSN